MKALFVLPLAVMYYCSNVEGFLPRTAMMQKPATSPVMGRSRGLSTMGAVTKVTGEELEKALSEGGSPVVLDVYATWCGPCQILAGELEKVAGLYGDKIRILKVDSDEEPRIATALKVYGLPTIFLIKEGQLIHRVEGAMPASDLTKLINHHIFGAPAE